MTSLSPQDDNDEKTNLIVNYLPQQMTDDEFENLFKKFGPMKSCKIVRNRVTGYSYGFGFVDFENHEQALKAIEELNGHELETKKIKVAFARPAGQDIKQANLYIKNVPHSWTQDDVRKIFEPYGNIIQVRVLGNNRGVAFVLYDLRKQAEDALEALNGKTVDGCEGPFEIKFAADKKVEKSGNKNSNNNSNSDNGNNNSGRRERGPRGGRNRDFNRNRNNRQPNQKSFFDRQKNSNDKRQGGGGAGGGGPGGNQNQFKGVPYGGGAQYSGNFNSQMNDIGPMRQSATRMHRYAPFVSMHQPIGQIAASTTMTAQMGPNPAYGFQTQPSMIPFAMVSAQPQMTNMPTMNQAGQIAQANPMSIYGTPQIPMGYAPVTPNAMSNIYNIASNNMNNAANMQPQLNQSRLNGNNNNNNNTSGSGGGLSDDGITLFVYNIGPDSDENELRTMFSPYGHVLKCNVVRKTPGGETKGFGFVTLRDRDQADTAIASLNGSMKNGRTLQVSLKK